MAGQTNLKNFVTFLALWNIHLCSLQNALITDQISHNFLD
jgi:hypothetical protein